MHLKTGGLLDATCCSPSPTRLSEVLPCVELQFLAHSPRAWLWLRFFSYLAVAANPVLA